MKLSDVAYSHENNFNLIRFLAAYAVLLSHSFALTAAGVAQPFMDTINYSLGSIAVDVFFVTSGFLVAGSLMRRPGLLSYFKSRALRIYPALWVVNILTVFLVAPVLTTVTLPEYFSNSQTWRYFLKTAR